ncbi:MAG: hypothetical protein FJX75_18330 [Armatimonadetes bacterium]|nr:hypothetical protein [Armatimonadota bacterium]
MRDAPEHVLGRCWALAVCLALAAVLGAAATDSALGQQAEPVAGDEGETVAVPRRAAPLAPGRDVAGTVSVQVPEVWYRVNLKQPGDARSLLVTLTLSEDAALDVDLALFDPEGSQLVSSEGTCAQERCLAPIEGLPQVFVRVARYELEEPTAPGQQCRFTLRAELSPRPSVAGIPVFVDGFAPLQDGGTASGHLPTDDKDSPAARWYTLEVGQTSATVARLELTTSDPEKAGLGFGVCGAGGVVLGQSSEAAATQSVRVPLEGLTGALYVAVWLERREPDGETDYALSVKFAEEETGPEVLERAIASQPKAFFANQRILGHIADPAQPFYAWFFDTGYGSPKLVICPAEADAKLTVIVRDDEGWITREQQMGGKSLAPIPLGDSRRCLLEIRADRACGFGITATSAQQGPAFDPATAQALTCSGVVKGKVEAGGTVVYQLQAPLSATVPKVSLAADPIYADLDLFICAAPGVPVWASATPGGSEGAAVLTTGAAPSYVVVVAPPGVSAAFELTVEEVPAAFVPPAQTSASDYLSYYSSMLSTLSPEGPVTPDPLADKMGAPDPFGGG